MLGRLGTTTVCEGREEVAIVIKDHGNGTVNLLVINSDGSTHTEFNVRREVFVDGAAVPYRAGDLTDDGGDDDGGDPPAGP